MIYFKTTKTNLKEFFQAVLVHERARLQQLERRFLRFLAVFQALHAPRQHVHNQSLALVDLVAFHQQLEYLPHAHEPGTARRIEYRVCFVCDVIGEKNTSFQKSVLFSWHGGTMKSRLNERLINFSILFHLEIS